MSITNHRAYENGYENGLERGRAEQDERIKELERELTAARIDTAKAEAENERLRKAVAGHVLDAKRRMAELAEVRERLDARTHQGHLMWPSYYTPDDLWRILRSLGVEDDRIQAALARTPDGGSG